MLSVLRYFVMIISIHRNKREDLTTRRSDSMIPNVSHCSFFGFHHHSTWSPQMGNTPQNENFLYFFIPQGPVYGWETCSQYLKSCLVSRCRSSYNMVVISFEFARESQKNGYPPLRGGFGREVFIFGKYMLIPTKTIFPIFYISYSS